MGKASKWLRSFLTGKKDKEKSTSNHNSSPTDPTNPTSSISVLPTTPKDKKRWSFRRSHTTAPVQATLDLNNEQMKHTMAMAKATAATKIQSAFRSYLARKALYALKGLVKLQALVRGHLVRKRATATLRCMQALITAQARARAQRMHMIEQAKLENHRPSSAHRRSTQDRLRLSYNDMERGLEENIKIVEMDHNGPKGGSKHRRYSTHNAEHFGYQVSPSPSALTDMSPRGCSGHIKDYGFRTAQNSPQCYSVVFKHDSAVHGATLPHDYSLYPNYMTNTESSRAKARSQSVPKLRSADYSERPARRRRESMEGRIVPRAVLMQRSSSRVGASAQNYQYPWSIKLDRSTVSLVDSECGSTSTARTNNYCRSVAGHDSHGNRY